MKINRLIAGIISLAMVFAMMPMMGQTVYAADRPSINIVDNGFASGIIGGQISNIYFGTYKQSSDGAEEPVKWRVLEVKSDPVGIPNGDLFLLSDQNLDSKKYNNKFASITWEYSTIRSWLNGDFINSAFSSNEQMAIKTTKLKNDDNPEYGTMGGNDTEDRIFLLSIDEAKNENYGFTNNYSDTTTREAKNTDYAKKQGAGTNSAGNGLWWLRSPGYYTYTAAVVNGNGYLDCDGGYIDNYGTAVRPAFNLNLKFAILTSAAVNGKSTAVGSDSLKSPNQGEIVDWKLTLNDESRRNFKVDSVTTCDGKTLNIEYSGALEGDNEYISAIIKQNNGRIKYYGKLALASNESGATAEVDIDGKMESGDTLCIFNEQCNGDYETDFSSSLQAITIPTQMHDWKDATCTKPKTCRECGVTEGNPAGHRWDISYDWIVKDGRNPGDKDYYKDVEAYMDCKICSETHLERATKVERTDYEPASCDKNGSASYLAAFDYPDLPKEIYKAEEMPAIGHKYGAWTKLDANQHQRVCEHDAAHIEKENHKWDAGKVTKQATETAEGVKTYTCTVCKGTKTEAVPKLAPSTPKVSGTLTAKMMAKGKTSFTISWNKIQGAEGYDVFFAGCDHGKSKNVCKKVKTIKGNKTFKWTKSGLKKGTAYKFCVRAYVYKNGKKSYVSKSPMMHAYTGGYTKNYTNAKSVKVNKTKVSLKKGKTFKIKASVRKLKKNKKLMPKSHAPTVRYMTSNGKVATISSGGKITAEGKGTCYVYVYAHNGASMRIKVTVK